jgi:salicylate 5-hydroxylase large subunit
MTSRGTEEGQEDTGGVKIAAPDFSLTDRRLIAPRIEFPDDVTLAIQTLFPSLIIQAQSNTLATRHIIPKGVGRHELIWTFFGYEDDDEEMRVLRLRQANLMGASGYVTLDDAEALEFSQSGIDTAPNDAGAVLELGDEDTNDSDNLVTETLIRGLYQHYRKIMALDGDEAP